ncbi:hypothetical protein HPB51_011619 [Rhipicephalus microplus]|uniref:FP protein C-terminal domain-containing protein n=1 Tax=Rhipicephalus microplus TaxID=6941 RepID=A0A9J6E887_RHIMP|nr:hypothetical protein HPB51_011619 [Rhipicephalus microplus]
MLQAINQKLDVLMPLKETVDKIEESVQFMSDQMTDVMKRTEENERSIKELRTRIESLEMQDKKLESLNRQLDDLEWRNRRYNLEFHGIRQTQQEDLVGKINALAIQNELPELSHDNVAAIHRLPSKHDKIPAIICRFTKLNVREAWWDNRLEISEMNKEVRVLENLTKRSKALLKEVKDRAKVNDYKYVWHRNNKILVKKAERHPTKPILDFRDVAELT